ncbi:rhomboid family intramembrane serine protease [Viscerimonas tarda]
MNQQGGFLGSIPVVTKNLLIINALCWLVQYIFLGKGIDISAYTGLHFFLSDNFMPHQLITYMFMHDPTGFTHVFFNMFAVFMFGRTLESVWGAKRFLTYYMITGIGAGLTQELVWTFQLWDYLSDPAIGTVSWVTVGASGSVFGILLAFGMLFPNAELIMIPIPIPIKAKYFVIGYGLIELFLGFAKMAGDSVAHFAHLGGLFFGLIVILYWRHKNKTNGRFY